MIQFSFYLKMMKHNNKKSFGFFFLTYIILPTYAFVFNKNEIKAEFFFKI